MNLRCRLRDEVEMGIREDGLLIRGVAEPRSGWDDAFRHMREHNDDVLVDEGSSSATQWDTTEWSW